MDEFDDDDIGIPESMDSSGSSQDKIKQAKEQQGWGDSSVSSTSVTRSHSHSVRDRIVVIGRRQAGKTVFLTMLYKICWDGDVGIHMACSSGPDHTMFMQQYADMEKGVWPAATNVSRYFTIDVSRGDVVIPLVVLDYPGEVFTKAFTRDDDDELTKELKDHLDRAAAVFIVVDPGVAMLGDTLEKVDDDYGISKAISRVRETPSGEKIPIAIVMTKCDVHKKNILKIMDREGMKQPGKGGGLKRFLEKYFTSWFHSLGDKKHYHIFPTAAVRTRRDVRGNTIPDVSKKPLNIVDPLIWCFEIVSLQRIKAHRKQNSKERAEKVAHFQRMEKEATRRSSIFWAAFLVISVIVLILLGIAVSWLSNKYFSNSTEKNPQTNQMSPESSVHVAQIPDNISFDFDEPEIVTGPEVQVPTGVVVGSKQPLDVGAIVPEDNCPDDPNKLEPGICGCGTPDTDTDGDGIPDCNDNCPDDPNKQEPGECDCGTPDTDTDGDGIPDCNDNCPDDPNKQEPGECDCGTPDTDTDGDGIPDCNDNCPDDPNKQEPGECDCGTPDTDADGDGTPDCNDNCPDDPNKQEPGDCGCGTPDTDTDGDGIPDCSDRFPDNPRITSTYNSKQLAEWTDHFHRYV